MATIRTIPTLAVPQVASADPLSALIQGFNQSAQMQQMPQQLANQAIAQQLAAQLQQVKLLTAQKQLEELNKTPIQRAREALAMQDAQEALKTRSLVEGPAGFGTIYDPGSVGATANQLAALEQASLAPLMDEVTITDAPLLTSDLSLGGQPVSSGLQLQVDQLPALDQAIGQAIQRQATGFQAPSAPLRGVEREIQGLPGLYRSSAAEREFLQREIDRQNEIEMNKIRSEAPGTFIGSVRQGQRGEGFTVPERGSSAKIQVEKAGNEFITFENGKEIRRTPFKAGQDLFKSANGSFIVTPNAQGQLDSSSFQLIPGTTPTSSSTGGGGLKPTGEEAGKFRSGLSIIGQIDDTLKVANEIQKTGKFPSGFQIGVNQFLAQRPQDIPGAGLVPGFTEAYAVAQNLSRGAQTKESRDIQMRKAMISSTILRLQAGLSQTLGESLNIAPYVPSESDSYDSLVAKLNLTREAGVRELKIQRRIFPDFASIAAPELGDTPNVRPTPSGGGRSFSTEDEARAAGFQNTDYVIINGVPGQLE